MPPACAPLALSLVQPASRLSLSSPELCFQYLDEEGTAEDALLSQIDFSGSRLSTDLQLSDEVVALKVAEIGLMQGSWWSLHCSMTFSGTTSPLLHS